MNKHHAYPVTTKTIGFYSVAQGAPPPQGQTLFLLILDADDDVHCDAGEYHPDDKEDPWRYTGGESVRYGRVIGWAIEPRFDTREILAFGKAREADDAGR